jgi:hypothetical protein
MANKTYLDELVEYPKLTILRLLRQPMILDLLANKRGAEIEDMEDDDGNWMYFFDYEYIPDTIQEVRAAFCIDTDVISVPNTSTKRLELYVSCFCSQAFMPLDGKIFKGVSGNRMNNLIRYADLSLRGDRDFGIGKLELKNVRTVTSGNISFAKKMLTYSIPDFNLK